MAKNTWKQGAQWLGGMLLALVLILGLCWVAVWLQPWFEEEAQKELVDFERQVELERPIEEVRALFDEQPYRFLSWQSEWWPYHAVKTPPKAGAYNWVLWIEERDGKVASTRVRQWKHRNIQVGDPALSAPVMEEIARLENEIQPGQSIDQARAIFAGQTWNNLEWRTRERKYYVITSTLTTPGADHWHMWVEEQGGKIVKLRRTCWQHGVLKPIMTPAEADTLKELGEFAKEIKEGMDFAEVRRILDAEQRERLRWRSEERPCCHITTSLEQKGADHWDLWLETRAGVITGVSRSPWRHGTIPEDASGEDRQAMEELAALEMQVRDFEGRICAGQLLKSIQEQFEAQGFPHIEWRTVLAPAQIITTIPSEGGTYYWDLWIEESEGKVAKVTRREWLYGEGTPPVSPPELEAIQQLAACEDDARSFAAQLHVGQSLDEVRGAFDSHQWKYIEWRTEPSLFEAITLIPGAPGACRWVLWPETRDGVIVNVKTREWVVPDRVIKEVSKWPEGLDYHKRIWPAFL